MAWIRLTRVGWQTAHTLSFHNEVVMRFSSTIVAAGLLAAVAYAAPKPRPPAEMSVTLDDGRIAKLLPDSTYTFGDGSVLPEDTADIGMLLNDGRMLLLRPDRSWALGKGLKPAAARSVYINADSVVARVAIDKGNLGKSGEAAREAVVKKAVDLVAAKINHPKVTRAMVAACLKETGAEGNILSSARKTSITASLTMQLRELTAMRECLEGTLSAAAPEAAPDTAASSKKK
jgi:hypothetical protein